MHKYKISPTLKKILKRIRKKDGILYEQIMKKIESIIFAKDIQNFKNLRYHLKNYKRVHVGHFVLLFNFDSDLDCIIFKDFSHHNDVYKHRYHD